MKEQNPTSIKANQIQIEKFIILIPQESRD